MFDSVEPTRLQSNFFIERAFPRSKGWPASIKDKIVSLFPKFSAGNDERLHKEGVVMLDLSLLHRLEEIHCEVPTYSKMLPTGLARGS
jgi:hypothetical protein